MPSKKVTLFVIGDERQKFEPVTEIFRRYGASFWSMDTLLSVEKRNHGVQWPFERSPL